MVDSSQARVQPPTALRQAELPIAGMDCADCALKIERAVGGLPGVTEAQVNFAAAKLSLSYDPALLGEEAVKDRIHKLGYRVPEAVRPAGRQATGGGPAAYLAQHGRDAALAVAALLTALAFALNQVAVADLALGDRLLVRPGERIPMDGKVLAGASAVNQAPITGESLPVEKGPGSEVFAGTVNGEGALEFEVTHLAADNTLARIIHLVEAGQAQKAPTQRFVDTFARYYTPAVVGLAALLAIAPPLLFGQPFLDVAGVHGWLYRALSLLIIACPCALVISTPVSIVSALSTAARNGVLIKGGAFLEAAGNLRALAFDKTGTLTLGRPVVTDVLPQNGQHPDEVLGLAAAVESRSQHPLAQAVLAAARERGLTVQPAADFRALTGRGATAELAAGPAYVGNTALFRELGPAVPDSLEAAVAGLEAGGKTAMLVYGPAGNGHAAFAGVVAVADALRPEAASALAELRRAGIQDVVVLTGDNERTARAVAERLGGVDVRASLMPEDKLAAIERLLTQHGAVGMVGDGVNDAPALARATVGIAMGSAGSDQALETADIALTGDDLTKLPFAVRLSRQARGIIHQNVVLSLTIKALFLALAVSGVATLWMAVFADVGASLIVTLNGMRLLAAGPRRG